MEKFEIWTIAGGEYTSKPRPCMIVQSDAISSFDTVIIVPITSFNLPDNEYRILVKATPQTGLVQDSFIELDKLSTVKKKYTGKQIGSVPEDSFIGVNKSIAKLLGISL